jgi:hypothetical protein
LAVAAVVNLLHHRQMVFQEVQAAAVAVAEVQEVAQLQVKVLLEVLVLAHQLTMVAAEAVLVLLEAMPHHLLELVEMDHHPL